MNGSIQLIASGDLLSAEELVEALRQRKTEDCDQARVSRYIGWRFAEALLQMPGPCARSGICLAEMAKRLPVIGGSHAQRDVFLRSLMAVAIRSQDFPSLRAIAAMRGELRHRDRFETFIRARLESGPARVPPPSGPNSDHTVLVRLI